MRANPDVQDLRDGDVEADLKEDESIKGYWFFNARTRRKPRVVGPRKNAQTGRFDDLEDGDIKSGDYGRVGVSFYGFNEGGIGVACALNNIQFLQVGDPLGGGRAAEEDFEDEEDYDGSDSYSVL